MKRPPLGHLLCAVALLLCGCAGYELGPGDGLAASGRSIRIGPFANQTLEPRLADAVTSALRKQIQRDGTYCLTTREGADIVVSGIISNYGRHELSFLPNDVLTVNDYRVNLTAQVTVRDGAGRVLLDQPVKGYTLVRVGSDLASAERQAMPLLAEDLAKNVTALLVDGGW
jgi:hypothetical protein